jgi:hypothetical protein
LPLALPLAVFSNSSCQLPRPPAVHLPPLLILVLLLFLVATALLSKGLSMRRAVMMMAVVTVMQRVMAAWGCPSWQSWCTALCLPPMQQVRKVLERVMLC